MAKAKDRTSGVSAQQGAAENQQQPTGQTGHTPGPWEWDLRPGTHSVSLMSRRFLVMDFVRWGMGSAAPRFRNEKCLMVRAEALGLPIPGREHHEWAKRIVHPDAQLIAAAPDLLAACEALMAARLSVFDGGIVEQTEAERAAEKLAEQAIAKATGKAGGQ